MSIVALSFLRLGDFFQHLHLLPRGEEDVHVLGFTELAPARELYPWIHFHLLDRKELFLDLTRKDRPWYRAVHEVESFAAGVPRARLLINFTHTLFSARMMDLLEAEDIRGARFHQGRTAGWNPALREFNETWIGNKTPRWNYIDFLAEALELPKPPPVPCSAPREGEIWLQPFTADEKKNWPLEKWFRLFARLSAAGHRVRVIGAPSEGERLTKCFPPTHVSLLSFADIRRRKDQCRLLVCGDTSVIHFAALEGMRVLGIYLGPANPLKTAPRVTEATVVSGLVPCSPCGHKEACSQALHECAEDLTDSQIFETIQRSSRPKGGERAGETRIGGHSAEA